MLLDEFRKATEVLFHSFNVYHADHRLRAYYNVMSTVDPIQLRVACRRWVESSDKFPTIAELRGALPKRVVVGHGKVECGHCSGDGRVSALDEKGYSWSYKCCCSNGDKFKNYPKWFGEVRVGKLMVKQQSYPPSIIEEDCPDF